MDRRFQARRRVLRAASAGLVLLGAPALAQSLEKIRRIGVLANHVPREHLELGGRSPFPGVAAFVEALVRAGWHDGRNVQFVWRSAEGRMDRHPALAMELVRMPVDIIVGGDNAIEAAARATTTIPIVAYGMNSPVQNRFADSQARPGRNITGIANSAGAELSKSLALLAELSPRIRRVALVAQSFERADYYWALNPASELGKAGAVLGVELFFMTFGNPATLPELVASAARQGAHALMIENTYAIHYHREHRERLARAAVEHRMPVMHLALVAAADGALLAHGLDLTAGWRRAAYFVDRILRGDKPGEIPIENPEAVQLHINLKAARDIGLLVPQSLLLQADRVFE